MSIQDIKDTSNGRCDAALSIRGAEFRCDLALEHDGWAHSSGAAESIWADASRKPEAAPPDTCTHESWEETGGSRRCADCRVWLPAPSDTDDPFESLVNRASLALAEDGWYSHDEALTWEDLDRIARTVLRASQPVQVEAAEASVTVLAKHMANAASDWNHNDCGDDDHPLEHSNWEAYTDDARRALVAALGGEHRG